MSNPEVNAEANNAPNEEDAAANKQAILIRLTGALEHSCECQVPGCDRSLCSKMKRIVAHVEVCRAKLNRNCLVCKQFMALCIVHVKTCTVSISCPIPFCKSVKQVARKQQLLHPAPQQVNLSDDMEVVMHMGGTVPLERPSTSRSQPLAYDGPVIKKAKICVSKPALPKPPVINPLEHDVVVNNLFNYCNLETLKAARLVCRKWNFVSCIQIQKRATIHFTMPSQYQCVEWTGDDRKTKNEQFIYYVKCYLAKKLPQGIDTFLFRHFCFKNFKNFSNYQHDTVLKFLQKHMATHVRKLKFVDDPGLIMSQEFCDINQVRRESRRFYYPEWKAILDGLVNVETLELVDMPSLQIEKCLTALEQLLEQGMQFKIRKLVLLPRDELEFHIDQFTYMSYVDLLKNVVSLLPIQELHIRSKCSSEEIRSIIDTRKNELKKLVLHRFVSIESTLLEFQNSEGNLFKDGNFPVLEHLELPTIYIEDLRSLFLSCPNVKHLKFTFQPTEKCELLTNQQGVQVIQRTRSYHNGFIRDQVFSHYPPAFAKDCKLESLHWALHDSLTTPPRNQTENNRHWPRFNTIVTKILTSTFPKIKAYTGVILAEEELRAIFKNLLDLEELTISSNSTYILQDVDIVGTQKFQAPKTVTIQNNPWWKVVYDESESRLWGIRQLKNLKRLYLESNNNSLNYESFTYGFLKLPKLQILHLRRAHKLCQDDTAIRALRESCTLKEMQILEN